MRRVRFGPALQRRQAFPPAHAVGLFGCRAVGADDGHVTVGVAAYRTSLVAQEIHAFAQHRLDIAKVHLALGSFGIAPSLAGPDQAEIVMRDNLYASAIADRAGSACGRHLAGLGQWNAVAHAAPIGVLQNLAAPAAGEIGY